MAFTEKIKEFGEKMIGRGPEVKVRNNVDSYMAGGQTREQAEKWVLRDRVSLLLGELSSEGSIGDAAQTPRHFEAVFNELFGADKIEQFKKDALDPTKFKPITPAPVTSKETNAARGGFSRRYKGESPDYAVLNDCAQKTNLIDALAGRVMGSLSPKKSGSTTSIESILSANPELGADIGAMMIAIEEQQRHDRMFERELKFGESVQGLKETAREQLSTMFFGAPVQFLKDMSKLPLRPDMQSFVKGFMITAEATTKLLAKEGWAGSKLLIGATGTGLRYLNTMRQ